MNTAALGIASNLGLKTFAFELLRLLSARFEKEHFFKGDLSNGTLIVSVDLGDGFFGQEVKRVADELTLLVREHGRDKFVELKSLDGGGQEWESEVATDRASNISLRLTRVLHRNGNQVYRAEVGMN